MSWDADLKAAPILNVYFVIFNFGKAHFFLSVTSLKTGAKLAHIQKNRHNIQTNR